MSENREHHASRKNVYSILVVPNGETRRSKNYEIAPWQIITGLSSALVFIVVAILFVLVYTPVGSLVPVSNPYLENKYGKELVSLSKRMNDVMGQLVELRSYNIKLRRALGENVPDSDSVDTSAEIQATATDAREEETSEGTSNATPPMAQVQTQTQDQPNYHVSNPGMEPTPRVVFPALMPVEGYTTRGYEPAKGHVGLDIAGKVGSLVCAAADGYVVFSGWTHDDGYQIILSHNNGFLTFYKHNEALLKPANVFVKRGEAIALLGSSGQTSSGPHLHFEIWKDGKPVDPKLYLLNYNF